MKRTDFRKLVHDYKVIFFDAYGVLKTYKGMIAGILDTFSYLHEQEIDFYVLTNDSSRSPMELAEVYIRAGIDEISEDKIVSSGMMAREYLRHKVKHGTVAYLGPENAAHYIETVGLTAIAVRDIDLENTAEVNALVLLDDEGFEWSNELNKAANLLRLNNIPVIVANTDISYPTSKREIGVAVGALSDMLERVVRKTFIRFGKPDTQMFHYAFQHIRQNRVLTKEDILMVGDTLGTDILGGNHFGIDTALVLTGNTLPHMADILIESSGIIPDYICESAVIQ